MEYRSKQLTALQNKSADDTSLLKAIALNLSLRMAELKKEAFEFQREVVTHPTQGTRVGGRAGEGAPASAEVLLRWQSEKLRAKRALMEKLQLKIRHQRSQLTTLHNQLKAKQEQGDSLHSIDFHQLQIKNSQYNAKVKDRNEALLGLKQSTGVAVNRLNEVKRILSEQLAINRRLKGEKSTKSDLRVKMDAEMEKVMAEIAMEKDKKAKYQQLQANPEMPQVMDYVQQKMLLEQLEREKKNLDRKIEIGQMVNKGRQEVSRRGSGIGGRIARKGDTVKMGVSGVQGMHLPSLV